MMLDDEAILDLFDRAVRPLRSEFREDLEMTAVRSSSRPLPIRPLDARLVTYTGHEPHRRGVASALAVVAACAALVAGLAFLMRDRTPAANDGDAPPVVPVEFGDFVWPAPPRDFAGVNDLIFGFADDVLKWDAFDLEGDITDERQPQMVTLRNAELGAEVTGLAVPSPRGWGFVQIGTGASASVDEQGGASLNYALSANVVEVVAIVRMTDGMERTLDGGTTRAAMPDISVADLVSTLIIGSDAAGRVVAVVGGQFSAQDAAPPTTPVSSAPVATTLAVSGDGRLEEALKPVGRIVVVNAAGISGLAGSLSDALRASGFDVLEPENAPEGVVVEQSIIYMRPGSFLPAFNALAAAVPVTRGEELLAQDAPALSAVVIETADIFIVLGTDLVSAPWEDEAVPLVDPGIGRLLVLDATAAAGGDGRVSAVVDDLRGAGVDVAGVAAATATFDDTMLMPIGDSTPWTFAVAKLSGVGGFDTWTPSLLDGDVPEGVTAVLVVGDR